MVDSSPFLNSKKKVTDLLTSISTLKPRYFIALKNRGTSYSDFIPLIAPQGKFYADPMLIEHEGDTFLFFEEFDGKKGIISYIKIDEAFPFNLPKVALELPIHVSFPFLFKENNTIYMIPETHQDRCVYLFKANPFPDSWEFVRILVEGKPFVDSILFYYDETYWLFTSTIKEQMLIYFSESLAATFQSHPMNLQRKIGRNSGPIFFRDGMWIRPTMDCRLKYGHSITLKKIIELSPTRFKEQQIEKILPTWYPNLQHTHTYSESAEWIAYDGGF